MPSERTANCATRTDGSAEVEPNYSSTIVISFKDVYKGSSPIIRSIIVVKWDISHVAIGQQPARTAALSLCVRLISFEDIEN